MDTEYQPVIFLWEMEDISASRPFSEMTLKVTQWH